MDRGEFNRGNGTEQTDESVFPNEHLPGHGQASCGVGCGQQLLTFVLGEHHRCGYQVGEDSRVLWEIVHLDILILGQSAAKHRSIHGELPGHARRKDSVGVRGNIVEEFHTATQEGFAVIQGKEAETSRPGGDNVEATVVESFMLAQNGGSPYRVKRVDSVPRDVMTIPHSNHAEFALVFLGKCQEFLDQLPVSGLENMQREHEPRNEDRV